MRREILQKYIQHLVTQQLEFVISSIKITIRRDIKRNYISWWRKESIQYTNVPYPYIKVAIRRENRSSYSVYFNAVFMILIQKNNCVPSKNCIFMNYYDPKISNSFDLTSIISEEKYSGTRTLSRPKSFLMKSVGEEDAIFKQIICYKWNKRISEIKFYISRKYSIIKVTIRREIIRLWDYQGLIHFFGTKL